MFSDSIKSETFSWRSEMHLEIGPINHYRSDKETETFISVSAIH